MHSSIEKDYLLKLIDEIRDYAILLLDREGNVQTWNSGAARIKGYDESEIAGKNLRIFYTKEDLAEDKPTKLLTRARETGMAHDEGWRVRKDGSLFWGSITVIAIHDDAGKIIGFGKKMDGFLSVQRCFNPLCNTSFLQYEYGWEFLEAYNGLTEEQKGGIIIVMLSASFNPDDKKRAEGFDVVSGFNNKPLSFELIDMVVRKYFPDLIDG